MKKFLGAVCGALLFLGCAEQSTENDGAYSRNGGGSLEGAGGAGPGFDGSGQGRGAHGTVPDSDAAKAGQAGNTQTNTAIPAPDKAEGTK